MRITIPTHAPSTNGNGHNGLDQGHNGNGRAAKPKTSPARVEANRRNARRSTGPRTDEGKRRSSMNALKHGVCSSSPLLPSECPGTFQTFVEEVREDLRPRTAVERVLVEQITATIWRLRRVGDVERAVLRIERERLGKGCAAERHAKVPLPPRLAGLEDESSDDAAADEMWPCEVMARCFASENAQGGPLMLLQRYERSLQNTLMRLMARLDALKRRKNSELYDPDEPPVPREYARPSPPPPPPPSAPSAPVRNEANAAEEEPSPDVAAQDSNARADDAVARNEANADEDTRRISPSPGTPGEGRGEGSPANPGQIQNPQSKIQNQTHPLPAPLPEYRARE